MKDNQMKECIKAISIMMNRFDTSKDNLTFYSAQDIVTYIKSLDSMVSTFRCDLDHLKLGLANSEIRAALKKIFGIEIEFEVGAQKCDIIKDGCGIWLELLLLVLELKETLSGSDEAMLFLEEEELLNCCCF
jgi:hypothetical protein